MTAIRIVLSEPEVEEVVAAVVSNTAAIRQSWSEEARARLRGLRCNSPYVSVAFGGEGGIRTHGGY